MDMIKLLIGVVQNFKPELFKRDLRNFPWDTLKTYDNPDEYLEIWYNNYNNILNKYDPKTQRRVKSIKLPL